MNMTTRAYLDIKEAQKLRDDLGVALMEYDQEERGKEQEAAKYAEEG